MSYNDFQYDFDSRHDQTTYEQQDRADTNHYSFARTVLEENYNTIAHSESADNESNEVPTQFQLASTETNRTPGFTVELQVGREEKIFSFDGNDNVVRVGEIRANGTVKAEGIDYNESYTRYGNFVVKSQTEGFGKTEFTAYADGDGDGRWAEVAEGHGQMSVASFLQMIPANYSNFG